MLIFVLHVFLHFHNLILIFRCKNVLFALNSRPFSNKYIIILYFINEIYLRHFLKFFIASFKPSIDEDDFELKQGSSAYGKD